MAKNVPYNVPNTSQADLFDLAHYRSFGGRHSDGECNQIHDHAYASCQLFIFGPPNHLRNVLVAKRQLAALLASYVRNNNDNNNNNMGSDLCDKIYVLADSSTGSWPRKLLEIALHKVISPSISSNLMRKFLRPSFCSQQGQICLLQIFVCQVAYLLRVCLM